MSDDGCKGCGTLGRCIDACKACCYCGRSLTPDPTTERQPRLAWESAWGDGFHWHIVLHEYPHALSDFRVTLNVERSGSDDVPEAERWRWSLSLPGCCFRDEKAPSALQAQLAAEDELARVASALLAALERAR
jgi:hypothetical protein